MATIQFETKPYKIGDWVVLRLPEEASAKLPSRGQTMVEGTINGAHLKAPLEPDGNWSHWLRIDNKLQKAARVEPGATVTLAIEPTKDWPEPEIPADLKRALEGAPKAYALWEKITPMARWEWVRWTRSTNRDETRKRRIEVAMSKLESGERRPCCWNRNLCTEPTVSKNGVLLGPG